jgi:hypothetical protein
MELSRGTIFKIKMKNVDLKPHQPPHVGKLMNMLETEPTVFDMSTMGLGKTYTSTECIVRLGIENVFIVCPVSMEAKWREVTQQHGIPNVIISSFASLRSVAGCQPKHKFLKRLSVNSTTDFFADGTPKKVESFEVTERFTNLVEQGLVMIVDEVHNLKNNSEQFRACKMLTDVINHTNTPSRCILLSGTPVDKEEQTMKMLKLMGLYTQPETSLLGMSQYVQRLCTKDKNRVAKIVAETPSKVAQEMVRLCHILFREIVCEYWVSTMPNTQEIIDAKNGYYKMTERDTRFLEFYIDTLHKNSGFTNLTAQPNGEGMVAIDGGKLGAIVKSLEGIEQSKIPLFERLVRETLKNNPQGKVCVGLNYVQRTLFNLAERLKDLQPGIITGETPKAQREAIIRKFQEPNGGCRLILANIKCLSTGVDLDDKKGDFPRFIFASPNYNIVDLHQFSRRFVRVDTASVPQFRFVYGSCARKERSILNALARKTNVMQEILKEQTQAGIKFPGDYDEFQEE